MLGAGSALLAGTQYAIVISLANTGLGSSHQLRPKYQADTNPYAGGTEVWSTNGGSSWTIYANDDVAFKEYSTAPSKDFTADTSISKDDILKTFTADTNLVESKKSLTVQASISQDSIAKTLIADVYISVPPDGSWPVARAGAYTEDKVWNEENKSWIEVDTAVGSVRLAQSGQRLKEQVVVISGQAQIYFGSL
jgi:hypothetical protein